MRRLILLFALACSAALAQDVPTDEPGFTAWVGQRIARELPGYTVTRSGALTLEGRTADGGEAGTWNLDRLYAFCNRMAAQCAKTVDQYSQRLASVERERNRPITRDMVRLAVRPQAYADAIAKQLAGTDAGKGEHVHARPVASGIAALAVLDFSQSLRFVTDADVAKLGLDDPALFKLGEDNLRASVRPLSEVAPVPPANAFGSITGEDYAASRVLFHDDWQPLDAQLHHALVVMIPAPDVLLYGDGSTKTGVDALRTYAAGIARRTDHPLPLVLLKWTADGWDAVR